MGTKKLQTKTHSFRTQLYSNSGMRATPREILKKVEIHEFNAITNIQSMNHQGRQGPRPRRIGEVRIEYNPTDQWDHMLPPRNAGNM